MTPMKIFAGNADPLFAEKIAKAAGVRLSPCKISRFADGEVQVEILESVRGAKVFVIQGTHPPVNENYMELFILLDALKRASAKEVTAVLPYYGYARQDRKVAPRAPISAQCVAKLLHTAGADRLVVVDLHSSQIQGFFDGPFDHLYGLPTLAHHWRERHGIGSSFVVVSPDAGGVERARAFAKRIEAPIAIIDKRRSKPNEAKAFSVIGDVRDKTVIIVDDMIDTAGTLTQGVDSLIDHGAKRVFAVATHPIFSGQAIERIETCALEEVWVSDSLPLSDKAKNCKKIQVVSIAHVVAEAIRRIHDHDSVSELFEA